jgi:PmbA protein
MQDLVEKVEQVLDIAKRAGADGAEVFVIDAPEDVVSFESAGAGGEPAPRTAVTVLKRGLGLAARWGGLVGFASTTDLEPPALTLVVEAARGAAFPEDPPLPLTPPPARPSAAGPGLSDKRLLEMNLPDLAGVVRDVVRDVREAGAGILEANGFACCRRRAVGNSLGLIRSSLDTRIGAAVYAVSPGGGLGGYGRLSRSLSGFRSLTVGAKAAAIARASDGPRDVVAGRQTVVLRPDAVLSLLTTSLGPALGADRVLAGNSPFTAASLGRMVAARILSITDDATRPSASGSYDFDAEGAAGRATPLIEGGRLVSFLHNSRTAAIWTGGRTAANGVGGRRAATSTGNASREKTDEMSTFVEPSGVFGYRSGVMPSNLVVQGPEATYGELEAAGVDRGLLVCDVMGAFVIDAAVGDFSVTTTNAWALERGRLAYPVKRAMLSGNVYRLLKQVCALVEEPEDAAGPFSLLSPSWVVADLTVI